MSGSAAQPLVTLAMAVWQPRPDWLRLAVDNALAQRGCETEVLLIDDGSEPAVATHLGETRLRRIRLVELPHRGLAASRNAAVREARGDYIRFLDYDDGYPEDSTARLLERTEGRADVIAYGTTVVCDEDLRPIWHMAANQEGDVVVDSLLARFNVRPGGLLLPKRVLELAGPFDESLPVSEDWDLLQRALEHGTVRGVPAVVHLYRRHSSAMTRDHREGRRVARLIVDRYFERHPEQRGTRLERRALAMLDATSARVYATRGEPKLALRHAARALRRDPAAFANESAQALSAARGIIGARLRRSFA
jgi:glycosyltransferase involved in cell wall biosynthesis